MTLISADAKGKLKTLLQPGQYKRLNEILYRRLGIVAITRDEVAEQMKYSDAQRKSIDEIIQKTQASVTALQQEAQEGKPQAELDKKFVELKTSEQLKLLELLKPDQQAVWRKLLGSPFDTSKLGRPAMKAPELIDTGEWVNSSPLKIAEQQGKVVVIHFYAFGCINCIHNYPAYREWQEKFKGRDVVLIGVHTPETSKERDVSRVRKKAEEEKLTFPILIDGKNENWDAWGNSMWPSVYLVDKKGNLRHFWPGELNWQGAEGEKFMREQIEQLLAEPAS
jgi:peroxiredoxin